MLCYIDAIFRLRENAGESPAAKKEAGGFSCTDIITSDNELMNDHPCYMWEPAAIAAIANITDTKSEAGIFKLGSSADIIRGFSEFLSKLNGNEIYVGWNMDQIVIPILCSCAFIENVCLPSRLFRRLDDKWSKTAGASVERAFMQGWYPSSRSEIPRITLHKAAEIARIRTPEQIVESMRAEPDFNDTDEGLIDACLISRISCISSIHAAYYNLLAKC